MSSTWPCTSWADLCAILLLGRPSPDFDVVVEGDAIALASTLARCYGGRLVSHSRFGTAKWTLGDARTKLARILAQDQQSRDRTDPLRMIFPESLDMISARTEFYDYPTALPTVERSSIKLDLHRRDFTINTMALRLDGRYYGDLYDYWGGLRDLRSGMVRVLHSLSFVDDPTRMMRAVRFEQRFGFNIEERTLQLIGEARELIRQVSGDRLRHELSLILCEEQAPAMLERLNALDLLSPIHPALDWSMKDSTISRQLWAAAEKIDWQLPGKVGNQTLQQALRFLIWLSKYSIEDAQSIADRLRLSGTLQDVLIAAKRLQAEASTLVGARPSQITARLDQAPAAALSLVELLEPSEALHQSIRTYRQTWSKIVPITTGDTLRAMEIPPGPHYRLILATLRAARLDGEIQSDAAEKELLNKLIQDLPDFI
jgi:tRNA nucleotidyltransferase (CCA-adding enzyme)